jgi:NTP pyrophosphatase (non-canonical NTP hydrolase)
VVPRNNRHIARCDLEITKIVDYGQPLLWLNVLGHADWEAEKHFINEETMINDKDVLNGFAFDCHEANKKWWMDINTGQPIKRNVGELIALCHSELSEALEGHRKGLQDDKLPNRPMVEVELADLLIRVFDMAGGLRLDIGGAYVEKMAYNAQRQDHTIAGRLAEGGKKY